MIEKPGTFAGAIPAIPSPEIAKNKSSSENAEIFGRVLVLKEEITKLEVTLSSLSKHLEEALHIPYDHTMLRLCALLLASITQTLDFAPPTTESILRREGVVTRVARMLKHVAANTDFNLNGIASGVYEEEGDDTGTFEVTPAPNLSEENAVEASEDEENLEHVEQEEDRGTFRDDLTKTFQRFIITPLTSTRDAVSSSLSAMILLGLVAVDTDQGVKSEPLETSQSAAGLKQSNPFPATNDSGYPLHEVVHGTINENTSKQAVETSMRPSIRPEFIPQSAPEILRALRLRLEAVTTNEFPVKNIDARRSGLITGFKGRDFYSLRAQPDTTLGGLAVFNETLTDKKAAELDIVQIALSKDGNFLSAKTQRGRRLV